MAQFGNSKESKQGRKRLTKERTKKMKRRKWMIKTSLSMIMLANGKIPPRTHSGMVLSTSLNLMGLGS